MLGRNSTIGLCKTLNAMSTVCKSFVPVCEAIVLGYNLISYIIGV